MTESKNWTAIKAGNMLSAEHLMAIGRVVVVFARLEELVSAFVGILMEVDVKVRHMVTGGMSFSQKSELLRSLCEHKGLAGEERLKEVFERVTQASEERNNVLHSGWYPSEKPGMAYWLKSPRNMKKRKKAELDGGVCSFQKIEDVADFIGKATDELVALIARDYLAKSINE